MSFLFRSFYLAIVCVCVARAEFIADAPLGHDEQAREDVGSLIRGKDAPLAGWLAKGLGSDKKESTKQKNDEEPKNSLKVEKPKGKQKKLISKTEQLFDAAQEVLKEFIFAEIKDPAFIKTKKGKVPAFDNTNSCNYEVMVDIDKNSNLTVTVLSDEDSAHRLKQHAKTLKNKIIQVYESQFAKS